MTRNTDRDDATKQDEGNKDMASWKPGSDAASAKDVKAEGDFGVPVGSGTTRQREYVSENTKMADPGAAKPFSHEFEGRRTAGAGARFEGDGSGSEGDLDPDVIGFGGGTGIAASGPGDAPAADDSDGSSNEMASGGPAQGRNQTGVHRVGGNKQVKGTVFSDADVHAGADHQGADAATNPLARGDDSFAAEVSTGEASGQDNSMAPSSDTDGQSFDDGGMEGTQKDFTDSGPDAS